VAERRANKPADEKTLSVKQHQRDEPSLTIFRHLGHLTSERETAEPRGWQRAEEVDWKKEFARTMDESSSTSEKLTLISVLRI
jgi:hypothetical protein